eukprot:scaffold16262_cov59-Phaeocystis_antarctica.AAC.2
MRHRLHGVFRNHAARLVSADDVHTPKDKMQSLLIPLALGFSPGLVPRTSGVEQRAAVAMAAKRIALGIVGPGLVGGEVMAHQLLLPTSAADTSLARPCPCLLPQHHAPPPRPALASPHTRHTRDLAFAGHGADRSDDRAAREAGAGGRRGGGVRAEAGRRRQAAGLAGLLGHQPLYRRLQGGARRPDGVPGRPATHTCEPRLGQPAAGEAGDFGKMADHLTGGGPHRRRTP